MAARKPLASVTTEPEPRANPLTSPLNLIYRVYVAGETRAASAMESLVGSNAFGELLAMSASNAMAIARILNGGADRGVRIVRLAGRADVTSLARQLARTEDKLERMLELVEELSDQLEELSVPDRAPASTGGKVAASGKAMAGSNHQRASATGRRSP